MECNISTHSQCIIHNSGDTHFPNYPHITGMRIHLPISQMSSGFVGFVKRSSTSTMFQLFRLRQCFRMKILSFVFVSLAMPEVTVSQTISATYISVSNQSATDDAVMECARLSARKGDNRYFTLDADGNCLYTQEKGSQYKRIDDEVGKHISLYILWNPIRNRSRQNISDSLNFVQCLAHN